MDWMIERRYEPVHVELVKTVEEAPGIKSFFFDYDKNNLSYQASQVLHLHLNFEKDPDMFHTFSIGSSPTEDFLLFTMKMRERSIYKSTLDGLEPGTELKVLGPVGKFILPADSSKQVVFLGDGIGVSPFRSMAKFATDTELPHKIVLLYSNRTPEDIVYRHEWEVLEKRNPNLTVVHTITNPEESREAWRGRVGKIGQILIREHVKDSGDALYYVCGPPSSVKDLTNLLRSMKIDTRRILIDVFFGYN